MIAGLICAGLALLFTGICIGLALGELLDRKPPPRASQNLMEPPEFLKRK